MHGVGCPFCDEYADYGRQDGVDGSRVVEESSNFFVVPTLGGLADGHLLVVSKSHETAVADLSPQLVAELKSLVDALSVRIRDVWGGRVLVFEHGTRPGGNGGGCGIVHLHVHLMPYADPGNLVRAVGLEHPMSELRSLEALPGAAPSASYLLVGEAGGSYSVAPVRELQSQYLRRMIGDELGVDWDWRLSPRPDRVRAAVDALRNWVLVKQSM